MWVDEIPVVFDAPLLDGGAVLVSIAPAPRVEDDEQWTVWLLGGMAAGWLQRLVVGGGIEEIFGEEFCHGQCWGKIMVMD